ncbi:MAG: type II toxin-antitoxin system RelE/ParE family toxin [Parvibaculum sp.]|nr:type II toxin-antitoxin system RelE/ParE family toxin [Parvibaculum sp.]
MARYQLEFARDALKEWKKLDSSLREQFKTALARRMEEPRIASAALSGMRDCYKIKLRQAGYRLVYRVEEDGTHTPPRLVIFVIAVAKRDRNRVYELAANRLKSREDKSRG